jgi:hypothetical protein
MLYGVAVHCQALFLNAVRVTGLAGSYSWLINPLSCGNANHGNSCGRVVNGENHAVTPNPIKGKCRSRLFNGLSYGAVGRLDGVPPTTTPCPHEVLSVRQKLLEFNQWNRGEELGSGGWRLFLRRDVAKLHF